MFASSWILTADMLTSTRKTDKRMLNRLSTRAGNAADAKLERLGHRTGERRVMGAIVTQRLEPISWILTPSVFFTPSGLFFKSEIVDDIILLSDILDNLAFNPRRGLGTSKE